MVFIYQYTLDWIQGQSIFVGVDEYDAPANNSAFAGGNTRLGEDTLAKAQQIESYFKRISSPFSKKDARLRAGMITV